MGSKINTKKIGIPFCFEIRLEHWIQLLWCSMTHARFTPGAYLNAHGSLVCRRGVLYERERPTRQIPSLLLKTEFASITAITERRRCRLAGHRFEFPGLYHFLWILTPKWIPARYNEIDSLNRDVFSDPWRRSCASSNRSHAIANLSRKKNRDNTQPCILVCYLRFLFSNFMLVTSNDYCTFHQVATVIHRYRHRISTMLFCAHFFFNSIFY